MAGIPRYNHADVQLNPSDAPFPVRGWAPETFLGWGIGLTFVALIVGVVGYLAEPMIGFALGGVVAVFAEALFFIGLIAKGVQVGNRYR